MTRRQVDVAGSTTDRNYTYDAWNRLVGADYDPEGDGAGAPSQQRARYTYNGLHQRVTRAADADFSGDDTLEQRNLYYYDASWRLCEERIDDDWDGVPANYAADRIVQRIWCPHYIDALVAMQTDTDDGDPQTTPAAPDGAFDDADVAYAVCDRKYDVIAMVDDAGKTLERVRYTAYGVARHRPAADVDGDGDVDTTDRDLLGIDEPLPPFSPEYDFNATYSIEFWEEAYHPDADIDRSGRIDEADWNAVVGSYQLGPNRRRASTTLSVRFDASLRHGHALRGIVRIPVSLLNGGVRNESLCAGPRIHPRRPSRRKSGQRTGRGPSPHAPRKSASISPTASRPVSAAQVLAALHVRKYALNCADVQRSSIWNGGA